MRRGLTREALASAPVCSQHGLKAAWLHARCHPSGGLWARFDQASGAIVLSCRKCEAHVVEVAVASEAS